jgi:hypothetical protein
LPVGPVSFYRDFAVATMLRSGIAVRQPFRTCRSKPLEAAPVHFVFMAAIVLFIVIDVTRRVRGRTRPS